MSDPVKPTTHSRTPLPASAQKMSIDAMSLQVAGGPSTEKGPNAVMYAFFQLFKTAQIHAIDNQAIVNPVQTMVGLTAAMVAAEGQISFQAKDRSVFVNGTKLKLSADEYELARGIFEFFEERGMGGFVVEAVLTADNVRSLLMALVYAPPAERKFDGIDAAIKASGIPFRINKPLGGGKKTESEVVLERRSFTFYTYSKLVVLYQSLIAEEKVNSTKRQFLMKKIGRTVQTLVDICVEDDHTFAVAAAVRNADAYAAHHAANVAVLSLVIGKKIGLPKPALADLGLAAVFFDIGLRRTPEIVDKPEPLTPEERTTIGQHPIRSVEFLLEEKKLSKAALSRIVVAFEHHRQYGGGGYPPAGRRPHLFTRIVSIADVYDALTTQRAWRNAYLPDEAIALMMRESGKYFDPALLKGFVNAIGLYPVGTLVRLDDGKLGVVVYGGGAPARATRPIVALIGNDGRAAETIDLAERDAKRSIAATEDAAKYGLQTSSIVAASAGIVN